MGKGLYSQLRVKKSSAKPGDLLDAYQARQERAKAKQSVNSSSGHTKRVGRDGLI